MRWGCREGFGRRLHGVGVLRVLGLGLRKDGVGFGVGAVPGRRDGGTEGGRISVWQHCVQEGGMERGSEGGKGKGRENVCVVVLCPRVFAKNKQRDAGA